MDMWSIIPDFPEYSVCPDSRVRSDRTGQLMTPTFSRGGMYVYLSKDRTQYTRALSRVVAEAFVAHPTNEYYLRTFDTPIHLDGSRVNNHAANLMWRPRWFAIKYHQQFSKYHDHYFAPVVDTMTGEKFATAWDAVVRHGLLAEQLINSLIDDSAVWPTSQRFCYIY